MKGGAGIGIVARIGRSAGDDIEVSMTVRRSRYRVYENDRLVLEVVDHPGLLISATAPPPLPGQPLVTHPFASAVAYVPEQEEVLRRKLDESSNIDEFLAAIAGLGMKIVEFPIEHGQGRDP